MANNKKVAHKDGTHYPLGIDTKLLPVKRAWNTEKFKLNAKQKIRPNLQVENVPQTNPTDSSKLSSLNSMILTSTTTLDIAKSSLNSPVIYKPRPGFDEMRRPVLEIKEPLLTKVSPSVEVLENLSCRSSFTKDTNNCVMSSSKNSDSSKSSLNIRRKMKIKTVSHKDFFRDNAKSKKGHIHLIYSESSSNFVHNMVKKMAKDFEELLMDTDYDYDAEGGNEIFILAVGIKKFKPDYEPPPKSSKYNRQYNQIVPAIDDLPALLSKVKSSKKSESPKSSKNKFLKYDIASNKMYQMQNYYNFIRAVSLVARKLFPGYELVLRNRHWHIYDISLGYMLHTILKTYVELSLIGLMRGPIFVIIASPILEFNVSLKRYIIIDYEISATTFRGFRYDLILKNIRRELLLMLLTSIAKKKQKLRTTKPKNIAPTNKRSRGESLYSDSDHVSLKLATLASKRSIATSYIWSLCNIIHKQIDILAENKAVDTASFNNFMQSKMQGSPDKMGLLKMLTILRFPRVTFAFRNLVNETMFEQYSLDKYSEGRDNFTTQELFTLLLKYAGHALGCTIISFLISVL